MLAQEEGILNKFSCLSFQEREWLLQELHTLNVFLQCSEILSVWCEVERQYTATKQFTCRVTFSFETRYFLTSMILIPVKITA